MLLSLLVALPLQSPAVVQLPDNQQSLEIKSVLAIPSVGRGGRIPFLIDPIEKQMVLGQFETPHAGDKVTAADGSTKTWETAQADKNGTFSGDAFEGGYSYVQVSSEIDRPIVLRATGDSLVYVNGVPRAGDPYGYGYVEIPAFLKRGVNTLLFVNGRGQLKVTLEAPKAEVQINPGDFTLPDAVIGTRTNDLYGGVVLLNNVRDIERGLKLRVALGGAVDETDVPEIQPHSILKVKFKIPARRWTKQGEEALKIDVVRVGVTFDSATTKFRVRTPQQTRKETYISPVDDSVQYYAVVPPPKPRKNLAMMLSLHGAGVEGIGQADAYSPKDWAYVVCATNRRPFGFDWEDWGREDGVDVLKIAEKEYKTDPSHTYVTGHSMGGHGTWQFGALFPDKWAAIGVSAGWASFYSYAGVPKPANPIPMQQVFERAMSTSNTLDMLTNYKNEGVYILHGDADDNVPVTEARNMRDALAKFDEDTGYHEQPGAGHWWSTPRTKGASCLEWPEMMRFLRNHMLRYPGTIDFTTSDLLVSPSYAGVTILEQVEPLKPSRVVIGDDGQVKTTNVKRLSLTTLYNGLHVVIDGQTMPHISFCYEKTAEGWAPCGQAPISQIGPFKEAFNNHAVLVYSTGGSSEENAWSFNKARFDSETFWYRGNGSLRVISDREYLRGRKSFGDAILYGNKDTNRAWDAVFSDAPISVERNEIRVNGRSYQGNDKAALFCWRRPGQTLNAGICATGTAGFRALERVPIFLSGVGFPDVAIFTPEVYSHGLKGVDLAGFWGDTFVAQP